LDVRSITTWLHDDRFQLHGLFHLRAVPVGELAFLRGWFPIFRFYGPAAPFFDKTWKLEDIAAVK
jgi:hypothetical protein